MNEASPSSATTQIEETSAFPTQKSVAYVLGTPFLAGSFYPVKLKHASTRLVNSVGQTLESDRNGMVILEPGEWSCQEKGTTSVSLYSGTHVKESNSPLEHLMEGLGMGEKRSRGQSEHQDSRSRTPSTARREDHLDALKAKTAKLVSFIKGKDGEGSNRNSLQPDLKINTNIVAPSGYLQFSSPKGQFEEVVMSATTATLPKSAETRSVRCSMSNPTGKVDRVFSIKGSTPTPKSLPDLQLTMDTMDGQICLEDYQVVVYKAKVIDLQFPVEGCQVNIQSSSTQSAIQLTSPHLPQPLILVPNDPIQTAAHINTASTNIEVVKRLSVNYTRFDPSTGDPKQLWLREYHMVMQDIQSSLSTTNSGQRRSGMENDLDSEWINFFDDENGNPNVPSSLLRDVSADFSTGVHNVIYDNPEEQIIAAATVDKLVERLAGERSCTGEFMEIFLLCYRHFISSLDLLDKLMARLNVSCPFGFDEKEFKLWKPVIKLRSIQVVKLWVEKYWFDFVKDEVKQKLKLFISAIPMESEDKHSRQFLDLAKSFCLMIYRVEKAYQLKLFKNTLEPFKKHGLVEFIDMDPKQVAMRLTVLEHEKFRSIRAIEFVLHIWGNKQDQAVNSEIHNITEMIESFNHVSYWVATEIITQPDLKQRIKVVEMLIKVAKELHRLENYNSLLSVVSGLSSASVSRLKLTWEGVGNKYKDLLQELEQVISPERNYNNYRSIFQQRDTIDSNSNQTRTPFIPIFGIFMKDFLFTNDGNPKYLETSTGSQLINWRKLTMIQQQIASIRRFQDVPYTFNDAYSTDMPSNYYQTLKEAQLYKYSQLCEPGKDGSTERLLDKWQKK